MAGPVVVMKGDLKLAHGYPKRGASTDAVEAYPGSAVFYRSLMEDAQGVPTGFIEAALRTSSLAII